MERLHLPVPATSRLLLVRPEGSPAKRPLPVGGLGLRVHCPRGPGLGGTGAQGTEGAPRVCRVPVLSLLVPHCPLGRGGSWRRGLSLSAHQGFPVPGTEGRLKSVLLASQVNPSRDGHPTTQKQPPSSQASISGMPDLLGIPSSSSLRPELQEGRAVSDSLTALSSPREPQNLA